MTSKSHLASASSRPTCLQARGNYIAYWKLECCRFSSVMTLFIKLPRLQLGVPVLAKLRRCGAVWLEEVCPWGGFRGFKGPPPFAVPSLCLLQFKMQAHCCFCLQGMALGARFPHRDGDRLSLWIKDQMPKINPSFYKLSWPW